VSVFHKDSVYTAHTHWTTVIKPHLLMLCKAKVAVYSEIHTKHTCNVIGMQNSCILDLVVFKVTSRLKNG